MAPKASEDPSPHESLTCSASSLTSSSSCSGRLDVASSSHSIVKHTIKKKCPIIRIVHVLAPKLIQTDVTNFRALVQKLTGNKHSKEKAQEEEEEEGEAEQKSCACHSHSFTCNQAIDSAKRLDSRYQKEKEATFPAYSLGISSFSAQFKEAHEHSVFSNHSGLASRGHGSIGYFPESAKIGERDECFPVNQCGAARIDEGNGYFSLTYDDVCSQSSPSSSDISSSTRGGSIRYERNILSRLSEELDIMDPSYPFINLDDQPLPLQCISALDTKFESISLLNSSW